MNDLNAPPAPVAALTPAQQRAQAVVDSGDTKTMLRNIMPTLRSELLAAEFMLAELTKRRDVQTAKRKFLKAAGKIVGGLPPMTDAALRVIGNSPA